LELIAADVRVRDLQQKAMCRHIIRSWDVKLLTLRVNGWRKIRNLDFLRVLRRQNALHGAHLVRVLGCRLDLVRKIQSGATGIFSKALIENSQFGDDFLLTRALVLRLRRRVKVEVWGEEELIS